MPSAVRPDPPRVVVRRVLSGGRWMTAAEVDRECVGAVSDDAALRADARLVRAGGRVLPTEAERVDRGRLRLVGEALNHLVHDGRAEGEGDGPDRRYRLIGGSDVLPPRPKPTRCYRPLERLTFDPRLQMREPMPDGGGVPRLYSERHVGEMVAAVGERKEKLPPLDVVDDGKTEWVIAGFHRGETYRRLGVGSVECLVYKGTFADAKLWALGENANPLLPRTDADLRRAVNALLDDPDLFARVAASGRNDGGVTRAIQSACRVSAGLVYLVLQSRGQHVTRDGRLEALPGGPGPARPAGKSRPRAGETGGPEPDPPRPNVPGPGLVATPAGPMYRPPAADGDAPAGHDLPPGTGPETLPESQRQELRASQTDPAELVEAAARSLRQLHAALSRVAATPVLRPHLTRLLAAHPVEVPATDCPVPAFAVQEDAGYRLEDGRGGAVPEVGVSGPWLVSVRSVLADLAAAVAAGLEG